MNLNHFDLNLLRALDALLTERNVTRAADRLSVTQQAMSSSLKRLRGHFDDQLLTRVGRQLELTPLAEALVVPVRETLLRIRLTLDTKATFEPATAKRKFVIAMTDYASVIVLPRLLRQTMEQSPHIKIEVKPFDADSFNQLEHGELDFCLSAGNSKLYGTRQLSADARTEKLFEEDFVCVVDTEHFSCGAELTRKDYSKARHNIVRFGTGLVTLVERGWLRSQFSPDIVAIAPSFTSMILMVPGTPLVATVQRRLAKSLAHGLGLSIFECPITMPKLEEMLSWHKRSDEDPAHRYVLNHIRQAADAVSNTISVSMQ